MVGVLVQHMAVGLNRVGLGLQVSGLGYGVYGWVGSAPSPWARRAPNSWSGTAIASMVGTSCSHLVTTSQPCREAPIVKWAPQSLFDSSWATQIREEAS